MKQQSRRLTCFEEICPSQTDSHSSFETLMHKSSLYDLKNTRDFCTQLIEYYNQIERDTKLDAEQNLINTKSDKTNSELDEYQFCGHNNSTVKNSKEKF